MLEFIWQTTKCVGSTYFSRFTRPRAHIVQGLRGVPCAIRCPRILTLNPVDDLVHGQKGWNSRWRPRWPPYHKIIHNSSMKRAREISLVSPVNQIVHSTHVFLLTWGCTTRIKSQNAGTSDCTRDPSQPQDWQNIYESFTHQQEWSHRWLTEWIF